MKRTTTTTLLSIIALALVVIAVKPTPQAEAQPQISIAPTVTGLVVNPSDGGFGIIFRIWSDGVVEAARIIDPTGNPCLGDVAFFCDWSVVELP